MFAQPLEVWDRLDLSDNNQESFSDVSSGERIELAEPYLIQNAFPRQSRDVLVFDGQSLIPTSDYEVILRDGAIEWNGSNGIDLRIRYKTAPVPNSVCVNAIEAAQEQIEQTTGTTFDGTETVTEQYDYTRRDTTISLFNRPVDSINSVKVFKEDEGNDSDTKTLTQGRAEDYYLKNSSLHITTPRDIPAGRAVVEIEYEYGHEDTPSEVEKVTRMIASKELMQNNTVGEIVDGREDYSPRPTPSFNSDIDEILNSYQIVRVGEQVPREL
jgi:hypothetical protein